MKYLRLFTGSDGKSHFEELNPEFVEKHKLGNYSKKYPVSCLMFRTSKKGAVHDWHCAPQPQYIVYLEGQVEVTTSADERQIFNPGDVLLAADTTGEGHITKMLTDGRSLVIPISDSSSLNDLMSSKSKL